MRGIAAAFWVAAFLFSLCTLEFFNDHFHRLSAARQIARYGELPFRDFFDPGYFLAELSSATVQRLLGDNLLGELLMDATFIGTGCVFVLVLATHLGRSVAVGLAAGIGSLLAMPRAYDYDKVLFYPLGLWLCWRYVDRQSRGRLTALGFGIGAAALFRYDSGVYLGLAAAVAIAATRGLDWKLATRDAAILVAATVAVLAPALLFVQTHGGVANAFDQMVTYGVRESEPLQIAVVDPAPPRNQIHVRWAPGVDIGTRRQHATQHALQEEVQVGSAEDRTFSYVLRDTSAEAIRAIVTDPLVEDTHLIDRKVLRLTPEPFERRLRRALPLLRMHMRPDMYGSRPAATLYYIVMALPLVSAIVLLARQKRDADAPRLWSLIVLCLVLDLFILRAPMAARIGGMAGIPAVLAAWLLRVGWSSRVLVRLTAAVVLSAAIFGLSSVGGWPRRLMTDNFMLSRLSAKLAAAGASPPDVIGFGGAGSAALIGYVHECTAPTDRVFATWYVPELFFFAQRPFAGRMAPVFAQHWSETRFQIRSVEALKAQSVPLVIIETKTYPDFAASRPLIDAYLRDQYAVAGESDFGDEGTTYRVLARKDRAMSGQHPQWRMPCFR